MTPPKPTPPTEPSSVPTLLGEQTREAEGIAGSPQKHQTRTRPSERLAGVVHAAVRQELSFFSGPRPPPEELIKYNDIFPDCGKTIVEMAQKEQSHRHGTDNRRLDGDITLAKRGQLIGGVLALVAVVGAIYLLANDKSITGLSVLGGVVLVFGGAFVYDRYQKSRPSKESDEDDNEDRNTQELRVIRPPTDSED